MGKVSALFDSPLGEIQAVADEEGLYFLGFERALQAPLGQASPLFQIEEELKLYFEGSLGLFQTPIHLEGTPFQMQVWRELRKIPFGETQSYQAIAIKINNPRAYRAVGLVNKKNPFLLIVPCHRVIQASGCLGGYSGGMERKKWLLQHEKKK